jgi:hypothetical protein
MKTLLTIGVAVVLVLYGLGVMAISGDAPSVPSTIQPAAFKMDSPSQPVQASGISPGVYAAAPYSMIVVVPKPVDPGMRVAMGDTSSKMPCIQPETRLEKR